MGWQWHQQDHMQIICTSLQTDNHTSISPLSFYRPDVLPANQPTASMHWWAMSLYNIRIIKLLVFNVRVFAMRSHAVCVWACNCIQSLQAAASVARRSSFSTRSKSVSSASWNNVPLLTGYQRHSNPVACSAKETTPDGRGRQQYSNLTKLGHSRVVWLAWTVALNTVWRACPIRPCAFRVRIAYKVRSQVHNSAVVTSSQLVVDDDLKNLDGHGL